MDILSAYLPADRYLALAENRSLPDSTEGTLLFADISGFTPLTESLVRALGPRRGAEELTRLLNRVYDALILQVETYGGVVTGFSGDAITCWFDRSIGEPAARALSCAIAMQRAMAQFAQVGTAAGETVSLAMKAALASGPARRFVVGHSSIQLLDVLAGATLGRMAAGEALAGPGEVLADEATVELAGGGVLADEATVELARGRVLLRGWRVREATGDRFAVVGGMSAAVEPSHPYPELPSLPIDQFRPWLLPAVYERLEQGLGEFLTELRPVTALFMRFEGIDYDGDERAGEKLDTYVRWVQEVVARYDGALLLMIIGDKGSYLYVTFGAPTAHEDDGRRAAGMALELRTLPEALAYIRPPQIGISRGLMRVGAYGGSSRRTYGVLGDEVNVAARLMQRAAPGQILVSGRVRQEVGAFFQWTEMEQVQLKGKSELIPVFSLVGASREQSLRLHEPVYSLPMIGRQAELALIAGKLDLAAQGQGQIVAITAEAGLGKSRLVAEVVAQARSRGMLSYGGECQSYGQSTPYLVWRGIWRGLTGVDQNDSPGTLEEYLARVDPRLLPRLPLFGVVVDIPLPDNELTASLDARLRKESLEALLVDCLKARATEGPLLLVLEDLHWIDPLSLDLLNVIGRAIVHLPVLVLMAFRPLEEQHRRALNAMAWPYYTEIGLGEFSPAEEEHLIDLRLQGWEHGLRAVDLGALKARVRERAQGNPFYIEELLNYVRDRGVRGEIPTALELPESLHSLILSRIDQLAEREKVTLKVASVVGRVFRVVWLCGYYPALGSFDQVKRDLEELRRLDLTPLDAPEPELIYLFKHIVTQEVAYQSLPYATRAVLHEQLARWLEVTMVDVPPLDLLAYHYGQSDNTDKKREYLRRAGEAAQAAYAHGPALDYYRRLLPLLVDRGAERAQTLLLLGRVLEWTGLWGEAESCYREALDLALQQGDEGLAAICRLRLGGLLGSRSDYVSALDWLEQARAGWAACGDSNGVAQALAEIGYLHSRQGEYALGRQRLLESLELARQCGDKQAQAKALNNLGTIAWNQGDYAVASEYQEQGLALLRELGDRKGEAGILNNLGNLAVDRGDYATARELHTESLARKREMGDKRGIAMSLNNLGNAAYLEGDYAAAEKMYGESLALRREMGDLSGIAMALNNLGTVALEQGDYPAARAQFEESLAMKREIGDRRGLVVTLANIGMVLIEQGQGAAARACYQESLAVAQELGDKLMIAYDLLGLAGVSVLMSAPLAPSPEAAGRAVRLAAAAKGLLAAIGSTTEAHEERLYETALAAARAVLDTTAFAAAWSAGEAMPLEVALAEALRL